ncbi:hypothetical protein C8F04DRAFT_1399554, partial [Mycena alexandri]
MSPIHTLYSRNLKSSDKLHGLQETKANFGATKTRTRKHRRFRQCRSRSRAFTLIADPLAHHRPSTEKKLRPSTWQYNGLWFLVAYGPPGHSPNQHRGGIGQAP